MIERYAYTENYFGSMNNTILDTCCFFNYFCYIGIYYHLWYFSVIMSLLILKRLKERLT